MAGKLCNGGLDYLDTVNISADSVGWKIGLYQNNHTPAVGDTLGNYTQCNFPGYSIQTPGAFTVNAAAAGAKTIVSPTVSFISTAADAQSIYGYYVTNSAGSLLWAELFTGGPYTIPGAGSGVQFASTMTDTAA